MIAFTILVLLHPHHDHGTIQGTIRYYALLSSADRNL